MIERDFETWAWDNEEALVSLLDVPAWIDQQIPVCSIPAIVQGGCESGAYMPAVDWRARETMHEHGDEIIEYLDDIGREDAREHLSSFGSWGSICCHLVTLAVEAWAREALLDLESLHEDMIEAEEEEEEEADDE